MTAKTMAWVAAGMLVVGTAGWALAGTGEPPAGGGLAGGGMGLRARVAHALIQVGLTDQQKHQVAGVLKSHREEVKGVIEPLIAARKALNAQIAAPAVDEAAIRAASRQVAALEEELAVKRARIRNEARGFLSASQRDELDQMRAHLAAMVEGRVRTGLGLLNAWIEKNAAN